MYIIINIYDVYNSTELLHVHVITHMIMYTVYIIANTIPCII